MYQDLSKFIQIVRNVPQKYKFVPKSVDFFTQLNYCFTEIYLWDLWQIASLLTPTSA